MTGAAEDGPSAPSAVVQITLAVVVGAAFGGYLIGVRPVPEVAHATVASTPAPDDERAVTYAALRVEERGPNAMSGVDLDVLLRDLPSRADPIDDPPGARAASVLARASVRAFDGAPPVVPHAIDQQSAAACLTCHAEGARLGERLAPIVSHPSGYQSCTQCHVEARHRLFDPGEGMTTNSFVGRLSPGLGQRAYHGAPPTMPHGAWMREDCASCHGPGGRPGLRTTHPERQSCSQCHAPIMGFERVFPAPASSAGRW